MKSFWFWGTAVACLCCGCVTEEMRRGVKFTGAVCEQIAKAPVDVVATNPEKVQTAAKSAAEHAQAVGQVLREPRVQPVVAVFAEPQVLDSKTSPAEIVASPEKAWTSAEAAIASGLGALGLGAVAKMLALVFAWRRKIASQSQNLEQLRAAGVELVLNIKTILARVKALVTKFQSGAALKPEDFAGLEEDVLKKLIQSGQLAADVWETVNMLRAKAKEKEVSAVEVTKTA